MDTAIFIPAIKKNVAFADDLVKKLGDKTLIQRAINKARKIVPEQCIYVVTDSEEICLVCKRNNVQYYYDKNLWFTSPHVIDNLGFVLSQFGADYKEIILLSPYAPLLDGEDILKALEKFRSEKNCELLIPVKKEKSRAFQQNKIGFKEMLVGGSEYELLIESQAFKILSSSLVANGFKDNKVKPFSYELNNNFLEISSYQDWWVSEKLLRRKRIVFRIKGDQRIGMGHIYRALTLAHEITDHEVYFICDEKSQKAVKHLAGGDYWIGVYKETEMADRILDLKPDLIINDILNTKKDYVLKLRNNGIKVVNFEDLGSGAKHSNLTINELYDAPEFQGKNTLWGIKYFFLREEFSEARPNRFKNEVNTILVTFGAADPNDFTRKIFRNIFSYCTKKKIKIVLVTGGGYRHIEKLKNEIKNFPESQVQYVHITGVISHIMQQSQIAIAANGRTPYELAHMNIPSIILSHNERELGHSFATRERGFIPLGLYKGTGKDGEILKALKKIVENHDFRRECFNRMRPLRFQKNKKKVLKFIYELLGN